MEGGPDHLESPFGSAFRLPDQEVKDQEESQACH